MERIIEDQWFIEKVASDNRSEIQFLQTSQSRAIAAIGYLFIKMFQDTKFKSVQQVGNGKVVAEEDVKQKLQAAPAQFERMIPAEQHLG